jgi:oxygen-independent coproporphyrinogen-3 oxidase
VGAVIRHLYVHVPFCPTICPFCDFHVLQRRAGLVDAYLAGVDREAAELADRFGDGIRLDTIYLGGGTPSHLRDSELERLVQILRRRLGWAETEAGLEAHPANVTAARARHWRNLGFTRVSLGVQSTDDAVLDRLGRRYHAAAALAALDTLVEVGGWVVNADLITAVAGQDVARDLRTVAARGVDSLSAYTLTIEAGTPFARDGVRVDPDAEADALLLAGEILPGFGLHRYEVSNHARPGAECAHNLAYWQGGWWLGLGPSATGHDPPRPGDGDGVCGWRRTNPPLGEWLAGARGEPEPLTPHDVLVEGLLTGLRLRDGADLAALRRRAQGLDPAVVYAEQFAVLAQAGLVEVAGGRARATAAGLPVLDRITAAFL